METSAKSISLAYFSPLEGQTDKYRCRCGRKRKKGNGWSNLIDHIRSEHQNWESELNLLENSRVDNNQAITKFLTVSMQIPE